MSYPVTYINCKICGADAPRFLGTRGNREYPGASSDPGQEHMLTNVVKCSECGFVYTNPHIENTAPEGSDHYDDPRLYQSSLCADDPLKVFSFSLDLIESRCGRKGKLLDLGCGKGEFLSAAKKRGWDTYGVEVSRNLARYANQEYGLGIRNCDLKGAGFAPEYFDAVALNMALEHLDEPLELMREINKVLKKGGLVYIEVPNTASLLLKLITAYYRFRGLDWSPLLSPLHYPYHCYGYNRSSLRRLLELSGFRAQKFIVRGIGLRGFRPRGKAVPLQAGAMRLLSGFFNLFNQGDVLIAVGVKT